MNTATFLSQELITRQAVNMYRPKAKSYTVRAICIDLLFEGDRYVRAWLKTGTASGKVRELLKSRYKVCMGEEMSQERLTTALEMLRVAYEASEIVV